MAIEGGFPDDNVPVRAGCAVKNLPTRTRVYPIFACAQSADLDQPVISYSGGKHSV
jgi:hypothetical protein